jgi:serine/threonine protein kinase
MGYWAPEQMDGQAASARSDLFSLGLVAWEMLSGRHPWDGDAHHLTPRIQMLETLPSIESLRPREVPQRLQYIVEKMLQKDPAARWQSADALVAALTDWSEPSDWLHWLAAHDERARGADRSAPARLLSDLDDGIEHAVPAMHPHHPDEAWWAAEAATSTTRHGEDPMMTHHDAVEAAEPDEPDWAELVQPRKARMLWQGIAAVVLVAAVSGAVVLYRQALAH